MMRLTAVVAFLAFLAPWNQGMARTLVVQNARIIDGTGRTIERGAIVVRDGRIISVTEGAVDARGGVAIDVGGMTVMPGLIDTHRHDLLADLHLFPSLENDADVEEAIARVTPGLLRQLLSEGFTTVMMPGMYLQAAVQVRSLLESGKVEGPRLLFSGPGFTAPGDFPVKGMVCQGNSFCAERVAYQVTSPDVARGHVRALAGAGVDTIKLFVDAVGADLNDDLLGSIAREARSLGLQATLHAHRGEDMMRGVRLGITRLAHTPGDIALAGGDAARTLRNNGVAIATTVSMSSPQFAKAAGFDYSGAARHQQILENIRHLVDQGVVVAFGTDSPPFLRPLVEVKLLRTVLEPSEIIATLTRNAAEFLKLGDEIGTLQPGKAADLVIIDGDPLADISALERVVFVIRAGRIVVDNH